MNILTFSIDKSLLGKVGPSSERAILYGQAVEGIYDTVVVCGEKKNIRLSEHSFVYGSGGKTKFFCWWETLFLSNRLARAKQYDLVSVQDTYFIAVIGYIISRVARIGFEVQVHGFEKKHGVRTLLARFILRRADSIRTVSQRLKSELVRDYRVDPSVVTVVPVYVAHDPVFRGARSRDYFTFLSVSRMVPVKRLDLLIEAFALLRDDHPDVEARLILVGDGPERSRLGDIARHHSIDQYVQFVGWQVDVGRYYDEADVFALVSEQEGWGMVIVEAARHGLPILMSDVGCAGEFIKNGENGLIVPVGDVQSVAQALYKLYSDARLRARFADAVRQSLQALPSLEKTMSLYKESWERARRSAR